MTFKNPVYFLADSDITYLKNRATFTNNGIITFESNAMFQNLTNKGILNLNANADLDFIDDGSYSAFNGDVLNEGRVNVNGMIRFQKIVNNTGDFYINNTTLFEVAVYNFVDTTTQRLALFVIESPTTFASFVSNNRKGATLIIKSPTIVNQYLDNFLGAITEIKGTTLTTTNGVWNYEGGIFIFSALNGQMGQLVGNFTNRDNQGQNEGKVIVNVRGLSAGTKYQIINGTQIQLEEKDVSFLYGTGQYLDNGWMWIDEFFALKTPIIATHRANVATMNNMFLASNAVMSAHHKNTKFRKMANRNNKVNLLSLQESEANKTIYFEKCLDCHELQSNSRNDGNLALDSLKSNKSFFYNSQDLAKNSVNLTKNHSNLTTNLNAKSTDLANPNDNFFFLLTPFVNHTSFKAMGDYQISGLDYGFISAFGGKVSKNHTLGTHFALDYANLGDKNDKSVKITNLNLMAGLNYRADLIYAMYLKARGDFYYFLNSADSSEMTTAKPNNLGFGLSVAFGKDFDFKQGGILGIELGLDYKAFHTSKVSANDIWGNASDEYKSVFYHLLYLDLGLNYYKYFSIDSGLWGIDAGFGIRGNLTPKVSNGTLMVANRAVDITLDNDNMLDYVSVGGSYVLEAQRFDMEFTLRYNGSFGDKSISNGGSFEWRVRF